MNADSKQIAYLRSSAFIGGSLWFLLFSPVLAQNFEQRGFIENRTLLYPQTTSNDSGRVLDQTLLRWEPSYRFTTWLQISAAFDARADSHDQPERSPRLDVDDRSLERPALAVRRLSATIHKG